MSISVLSWRGKPVQDKGQWYIDIELEIGAGSSFGTVLETSINRMRTGTAISLEEGVRKYSVRADCGDVDLWQANTIGIPHVYPLQLRMGEWSDFRLFAFYHYEIKEGKPYLNGSYFRVRGITSRITKGMLYEGMLRSEELSGLNAVVLNGMEGHSFKDACLRVGLLPLKPEEVPPTVRHINALPCKEGEYLPEIKQYFDGCDGIMRVRSDAENNSGFIIHSLNDKSDGVEDGVMTKDGKWKLLQYGIRRFSAPLAPFCLQEGDKIHAYVTNDTDKEQTCELLIKLRDFSGRKLEDHLHTVTVPAHSKIQVKTVKVRDPLDQVFCYVRLSTKDILRERTFLLSSYKRARLMDPGLKAECKQISAGTISIKLTAERPAFYVAVSSGKIKGIFSDNMIAVRPTAAKSIIFQSTEAVKLADFQKEMKLYDVYSALRG